MTHSDDGMNVSGEAVNPGVKKESPGREPRPIETAEVSSHDSARPSHTVAGGGAPAGSTLGREVGLTSHQRPASGRRDSALTDDLPTILPGEGRPGGLKIERRFALDPESGRRVDPYRTVEWEKRDCTIRGSDGSIVFQMEDVEIPSGWSAVAGDVMASKYMRKAGVPQYEGSEKEGWGKVVLDKAGHPIRGPEKSTGQVVRRLVKCWRHWGEQYGYFASELDAKSFEDDLAYMLLHQYAAPNSPQWFNTGLQLAYGLTGPAQGHYYVDPTDEQVRKSTDAYSRPQPHACFIQAVTDDLVNPGGIMDLWTREARLFKYGSGTGTNFSRIRGEGEPLAGGGYSSGLMSFLKIGDRAAGAIKSGGTTRRAAKMVCLDVDHPDIEAFVNWKKEEEHKVAAMIAAGYPSDFNGEAYATVSGQNSNNSIRVTEEFLRAVSSDSDWNLKWRTDGRTCKTLRAKDLWRQVCEAAWACADPGLQFDTTVNDWHTCPNSGRINASNPCSEYMFLDNTACNLASINLVKFYDVEQQRFDVEAFRHAVRLWTIVLEISVLMAQFPSREIAELSYKFRTLGLGYANLGTLLMLSGIPYDSDKGRAIGGALTSIMTGESYAMSAEMARGLGTFPGYEQNRAAMLRVIRNHRSTAYNAPEDQYDNLSVLPQALDARLCPDYLLRAAQDSWDSALELGQEHGYRNAQATVIAPTGTIGLLMDCDTTGIEPDFALVKFKKLAGGGYFKIPNRSVEPALAHLGYSSQERREIMEFLIGTNRLEGAPHVNRESLREKGFTDADLDKVDESLVKVFDLPSAFNVWTLGEECLERLGMTADQYDRPEFSMLEHLGFTRGEIAAANAHICGRHTVEGAPHIKDEHLAVFDCANRCGATGERFIRPEGHLRMMAAAQPFVSGAISKTINMPRETTVKEISDAYLLSWKLGIKATALYRDGCKLSQPLSTKSDSDTSDASDGENETVDGRSSQKQDGPHTEQAAAPVQSEADRRGMGRRVRRPMPAKRRGFTQEAKVGGHKIYLRTGEYEDHTLGEIFIDMHKEGAAFRGLMNCFAIAISKGLQYGVPLEEFVDTFTFTRFAPQGQVDGHPNIKLSTSVLDYVFRVLGLEYLGRTDIVHVKPEEIPEIDPGEKNLNKQAEKPVESAETTGGSAPAGNAAPEDRPAESVSMHSVPAENGARPENSEAFLGSVANEQLARFMEDAPTCSKCGQFTIRNGSCYRCLFCGESEGCG